MGDRPHSSLLELMPEKLLRTSKEKVSIRKLIKKLSIALPATITAAGVCRNGLYRPKTRVWKKYYDPLHVLLRATPRRQYQDAEHRYHEYLLSKKMVSEASELAHLWPPFVVPRPLDDPHVADPRNFLISRTLHAVFFVYLYKALHQPYFSPSILPYLIYLIEMTVEYHVSRQHGPGGDLLAAPHDGCPGDGGLRRDLDLGSWYCTDHIFRNAITLIPGVTGEALPQPPSDDEMDFSETSSDAAVEIESSAPTPLSLPPSGGERPSLSLNVVGSEIVAYHRDPSVPDTPLTPLTPTYPSIEGGDGEGNPLDVHRPSSSPHLALAPPGGEADHEEDLPAATGEERAVVPRAESTYLAPPGGSELCCSSDFALPAPLTPAQLPAPPQYPPLLAGTEVGRPGTSSGTAPGAGVMVPAGGRRRRHTGSPHPPLVCVRVLCSVSGSCVVCLGPV
ncbi:hypothetical protein FHG87_017468 [Trinorchestia longiramus]|nr:hypothetical protein FHG87_017468 [Trinorchestia longiramus]